jgi:uncharacterized protein
MWNTAYGFSVDQPQIYHSLMHRVWHVYTAAANVFQGTYTVRVLSAFLDLFFQLWYFVLLGAFLSTAIWFYLPKAWIRDTLRRHAKASVPVAIGLGLVSPLCTFAAIPVVGSLMARGAPAAPLVAFMMTSPLMNPALFVYTAGIIDMEMALARVLTAASVGLAAAVAVHFGTRRGCLDFARPALGHVPEGLYAAATAHALPRAARLAALARRFVEDLWFIARFFLLGIGIAALAQSLLSEEMVYAVVGPGSGWAVPLGMALGIPLYACGGGSLPVVEAMIQTGMTSGAALAFFISGPSTKFSTLTMLAAVFGRRILVFYLGLTLAAALFWGYAYPFSVKYL